MRPRIDVGIGWGIRLVYNLLNLQQRPIVMCIYLRLTMRLWMIQYMKTDSTRSLKKSYEIQTLTKRGVIKCYQLEEKQLDTNECSK